MSYKRFLGAASAVLMVVIVITLMLAPSVWAQTKYQTLYRFKGGADGRLALECPRLRCGWEHLRHDGVLRPPGWLFRRCFQADAQPRRELDRKCAPQVQRRGRGSAHV